MIKIVTSATVFRDSLGMRLSYTYSEVDESTGQIISDNNRGNRMVTDRDRDIIAKADDILAYAQQSVEG